MMIFFSQRLNDEIERQNTMINQLGSSMVANLKQEISNLERREG